MVPKPFILSLFSFFMKNQLFSLASAFALTLCLASCGKDKPAETTAAAATATTANSADSVQAMAGDSARMAKPGGVMVDGVAMTADKDIVDNAAGAKSVSTLVSLVTQAGLVETLKGAGPFTVFAPTNAAFAKLPKAAVAALTAPANAAKLKGVLTYHVIAGRLLAADLKDGQELTTVNGEKLKVSVKDGKVMLSNGKDAPVTVLIADVISKNGVTHVVDGVLLPLEKK